MIYSLIVLNNHLTTGRNALDIAIELVQNHTINQIYFLFDGVYAANKYIDMPVDEFDLTKAWENFSKTHNIPLIICSASGLRRGIVENTIANGFRLGTIGQLVEGCDNADKVLSL